MRDSVQAVALFTDFGPFDSYQGEMKAALHVALPKLPVFDLMAGAPQFNPKASAYLLAALLKSLPAGMLVLPVVDPGVGSDRKALLVEVKGDILIGPDNGLMAIAVQHFGGIVREIHWRPQQLSSTFHGRDLFAPAAIRYLTGRELGLAPLPAGEMVGAGWPADLAEIIHIDSYGNLISGIRAVGLRSDATINYAGQSFARANTFADLPVGDAFWYENSAGLVELAINQGSAAGRFSAKPGEALTLL